MIYSNAGAPESDFQTTLHSVCRIYNDYDYFVELEEGNKPFLPCKIPSSHSLQKSLVIRIPKRRQNNVSASPSCLSVEYIHYTVVFLTCVCLLSMPFVAVMR